MREFLANLKKPKYNTLNKIQINKQRILDNYSLLCQEAACQVFPVLKSNAYGHGLKELCLILNDSAAKMVAVDSFPEAQIALKHFKGQVLVLGEMPVKVYSYVNLKRTEFCVYNVQALKALAKRGQAKVHLFVNTGMNREGIKDLHNFIKDNTQLLRQVKVLGLCSHLASAETNSALNKQQVERFLLSLKVLQTAGFNPEHVHLGNSAAIFTLKNPALSAFRSGIALYGYNPLPPESAGYQAASKLQAALRLTSTVVSLQSVSEKEKVSYNETYEAINPEQIAVIPFGYYEGLDRRLSNQAQFCSWVGDNRLYVKIAGTVCMNLCCLEDEKSLLRLGDQVEIISWDRQDLNSLDSLAKIMNTIVYEPLVKLQANIHREIVN